MKRRELLRWTATVFAVVVLAGFSVELLLPRAEAQSTGSTAQGEQRSFDTPTSDEVLWAYQNAFRKAAHEALPVVVKIDVVDVVTRQVPSLQNPFSFLFGQRDQVETEEREFRRPGLGSGVIVRRAGDNVYVLTNDHVV